MPATPSPAWPRPTATYVGTRSDSRRWEHFTPRADDVFICTPPKCGTTWTQAICALLVFGGPGFEGRVGDLSPWLDGVDVALDACLRTLEAQQHRRILKTHTPLDGIPFFPGRRYLVVYRDPRDAYFSLRSHLANMRNAPPIAQMAADPREGFRAWVDAPFQEGVGDQRSLAMFVRHYLSFAGVRGHPDVHFFHYADYKRDLRASIAGIAGALGIQHPDPVLDAIGEALTFDNMKARAETFAPAFGRGLWKDDRAFFSKGENTQWRDVLGADDLDHYAGRIASLLPAADVDWLENGSGAAGA